MTSSAPITFYDIAFKPPVEESTGGAPNPWKARYALNFKKVSYSTTWVQLPDIPKVRQAVGAPASRKFVDGSDYYTLPMITDSTKNAIVGDSFDIAVHLQQNYPESGGDLFPPQTLDFVHEMDLAMFAPLSQCNASSFPDYAHFNRNVDAAFSAHVQLMAFGLPFDPATADITKAEFCRRAGVSSWDDLAILGDPREKLIKSLHNTLVGLAKLFERDSSGPFLLGNQASHADFIVGGWLRMMHCTLPQKEWEEAITWHDGIFGKLHRALTEQYAQVK